MKKANDDILITFNDESEWEWDTWEEPYIKALFEHAKIKATEIYAEDVYEYEDMRLLVKEVDEASGEYIENEYAIHFYRDYAIRGCIMLAHFLWQVDGCAMTLIDQGIYQIHTRADGTRYCLLIAEET